MKVREPVARPLDVVAAELLLSASQAFLVGVLAYLAVGVWDERGVGFGPVAVIVAGMGIAIGGSWLYWLLGGVGWPLAAANVPTSFFLGFALVLGWSGNDLFRVEGAPLLLGLVASVYGLICGAFLDSPRRLRWDQRQRPRPGTPVPRVSPTTQRFAASVPRSIPRRTTASLTEPLAPRAGPVESPGADGSLAVQAGALIEDEASDGPAEASPDVASAPDVATEPSQAGAAAPDVGPTPTLGSTMPTERLEKMATADASAPTAASAAADEAPPAIELPTSIEPKAQKSPWAWAAPPEWTRDEDDEPPRRRSSKRS